MPILSAKITTVDSFVATFPSCHVMRNNQQLIQFIRHQVLVIKQNNISDLVVNVEES